MALMGCVGSRAREALLLAAEEAVKESAVSRLETLLSACGPGGADGLTAGELAQRHLLHQAAWLGHTACVRLLLQHGASPDEPHRKNGCTPLHLAHFCTIDDTDPARTLKALTSAGADINNRGSRKCDKLPIDHAIQHQRLDSVQVLLRLGSQVTLQSMLLAIDVASPQIVELLLIHGADCGSALEYVCYWGQPLHRALYARRKCPREPYKQMFRLLVQATVCTPSTDAAKRQSVTSQPPPAGDVSTATCGGGRDAVASAAAAAPAAGQCHQPYAIEWELRSMAKSNADLAQYLVAFLLRSGYRPPESVLRALAARTVHISWAEEYLRCGPVSLRDLCVRSVRSALGSASRGNIMYGLRQLHLPSHLSNLLLLINPL